MSLSDCEGDTKGLSLAGRGTSEAEGAAEDAIPLFHNSNITSFHLSKIIIFPLNF